MDHSTEALPICQAPLLLHVHYTQPQAEVVPRGGAAVADLDASEPMGRSMAHTDLQVSQTVKVSVTYDVAKVDELEAV